MQITHKSIPGRRVVFESILDEVPGGVAVKTDRLYKEAEYLPAGTPVYVDLAARTAEVCKSTRAAAAGTATTLKVPQGHHFKVGDYITDFTQNRAITGIAPSGDLDVFTVVSGLVTTVTGTLYGEAAGSGAYSGVKEKYLPNGLIKDITRIKEGNADAPIVKIGTAREDALAFPLPEAYKIALRGGTDGKGTSLITIV